MAKETIRVGTIEVREDGGHVSLFCTEDKKSVYVLADVRDAVANALEDGRGGTFGGMLGEVVVASSGEGWARLRAEGSEIFVTSEERLALADALRTKPHLDALGRTPEQALAEYREVVRQRDKAVRKSDAAERDAAAYQNIAISRHAEINRLRRELAEAQADAQRVRDERTAANRARVEAHRELAAGRKLSSALCDELADSLVTRGKDGCESREHALARQALQSAADWLRRAGK